jgi:hypothetical protein
VDLLVNDVLVVELKTVKALDAHTGCNAPVISRRPPCNSALLFDFGKLRLEIICVAHGL